VSRDALQAYLKSRSFIVPLTIDFWDLPKSTKSSFRVICRPCPPAHPLHEMRSCRRSWLGSIAHHDFALRKARANVVM